ncbi:unnamed protein product [Acanthoscelides obtectus]|uniref:Uncharacterized protein n=1 Tax=Acanthoscelides obtectus TaxID=200917 RepID=A0A9P0KG23_ACAOB|nr:unnamed protein product [Acanthoscelides obtectus]CAK1647675.1 hypothetical protein AOBTE_LOCUS15331 [Acanthoscelides obtectus]
MYLCKAKSRKIFAIPKNVLLEEDQYKVKKCSNEEILQLKIDVIKLEEDLIKEQLLLSKCKRLNEMIKSNVTPMYEKVNDLLSTPHNRVSKKNEISIEHKKELDETSSVDEIQRIVNYKMMGYTLLNGAPKSMITDLRLSS